MSASEQFNTIIKDVLSRFTSQNSGTSKTNEAKHEASSGISLSPEQALIIAGFLGGVLIVDSVLVDRNQNIEIVLTGSLKQKTQMEKMMDQIGTHPFDEVVKAFLGRMK